jgi:hypothetical protein
LHSHVAHMHYCSHDSVRYIILSQPVSQINLQNPKPDPARDTDHATGTQEATWAILHRIEIEFKLRSGYCSACLVITGTTSHLRRSVPIIPSSQTFTSSPVERL